MLALTNNKPVLCEKIFTINAAQARILYDTARSQNLLLMENVWTRFIPLSVAVREYITSGKLGEIVRVQADLSYGETPESWPEGNRMINKALAGGCLFDLGVYSLTWIFQSLYHTLPESEKKTYVPQVKSIMSLYSATGIDETTTILVDFPSPPSCKTKAHGIATTSFRTDWDPDKRQSAGAPIRIQGSKATLHVYGPASRPSKIRVIPQLRASAQAGMTAGGSQGAAEGEVEEIDFGHPGIKGGGRGMFWAADEAARCVREGKLESEVIPWEESLLIMSVIDEVRRQGGLKYPKEIESTDYP
jgi:predicted dehydrogenase